jgi:hypothetical protein
MHYTQIKEGFINMDNEKGYASDPSPRTFREFVLQANVFCLGRVDASTVIVASRTSPAGGVSQHRFSGTFDEALAAAKTIGRKFRQDTLTSGTDVLINMDFIDQERSRFNNPDADHDVICFPGIDIEWHIRKTPARAAAADTLTA